MLNLESVLSVSPPFRSREAFYNLVMATCGLDSLLQYSRSPLLGLPMSPYQQNMEHGSSWLLSQCRVGSDSLLGVQCDRGFRYRIHATAPNLESSYAKEVEDTTDWHLPS